MHANHRGCLSMHPTRRCMQSYEKMRSAKRAILKKWSQLERPDSFDSCDPCHTHEFSNAMYLEGTLPSKNSFKGDCDQEERLNTRVLC
ncbi:hypothetical protein BS78_K104000 [Paspalum vaginatum]|uniref:Uncharacterized protein n=1 Tax=Paspalum vaginatum TaxID=158149 RepID=A0A9W7X6R3_9POAL|nr:hypothetical protein BS78_K104000 [Paspalum vaginatum]